MLSNKMLSNKTHSYKNIFKQNGYNPKCFECVATRIFSLWSSGVVQHACIQLMRNRFFERNLQLNTIKTALRSRVTGWDCEKIDQNCAQTILLKINTQLFVLPKNNNLVHFCNFEKKTKVNIHPKGENSPNLVTLLHIKDTLFNIR
jgi:hypothetical protein